MPSAWIKKARMWHRRGWSSAGGTVDKGLEIARERDFKVTVSAGKVRYGYSGCIEEEFSQPVRLVVSRYRLGQEREPGVYRQGYDQEGRQMP